ncbi:MAG: hypothetical protein ABI415_08025 [Flavitalea sp.]
MFRSVTAILLLIAFATQTFERTFLVLDYYANTASFAEKCENKMLPLLHCNGQCLLMKKMKEQEHKDQQAPERKSENKSEVIPSSIYVSQTFQFTDVSAILFPSFKDALLRKSVRPIFHPPSV